MFDRERHDSISCCEQHVVIESRYYWLINFIFSVNFNDGVNRENWLSKSVYLDLTKMARSYVW